MLKEWIVVVLTLIAIAGVVVGLAVVMRQEPPELKDEDPNNREL